MTVRAKFTCSSVTKSLGWGGNEFHYNYKFQAVTSGSEENKQFFASTPGGNIELTAVRNDLFSPGKQYYLDFKLAEEV